jgi:hypothetical protein
MQAKAIRVNMCIVCVFLWRQQGISPSRIFEYSLLPSIYRVQICTVWYAYYPCTNRYSIICILTVYKYLQFNMHVTHMYTVSTWNQRTFIDPRSNMVGRKNNLENLRKYIYFIIVEKVSDTLKSCTIKWRDEKKTPSFPGFQVDISWRFFFISLKSRLKQR